MAFGYTLLTPILGASLIFAWPRAVVTPNELMYSGRDGGASSCTQLTLDQAKGLPGWPQIVQYAKDTYGDDGLKYVLNPPEYPNTPAIVCVDQQPISISMQAAPSCSTGTDTITGTINGTTGSVSLSHIEGYTSAGTWSITQSSSLAVGLSFTASVGIPDVMTASTGVTTTATFTNAVSTGFTTTVNSETVLVSTINVGNGQNCTGTLTTTTCTGSGTGTVQYIASGSVWFYYDKKRAPKSDPNGAAHYKYGTTLESVLDVNDRSSSMKFMGFMQMDSNTHFSDYCVPL
ncbi:hypothetical protein K443DRAFT_6517 [Laccaria amethystina LaAM-08-1]|uniref:Uncharacterized protein n=1 Tax=Laccaria amethystina LaAM-08-1 TaxID=1095629 RepID=A0A0C9Y1V1_9AGAR|nr:hypothetical protein K443DRAFT_6517 [Laccaria amethystina LaAM-08-1]